LAQNDFDSAQAQSQIELGGKDEDPIIIS